MCDMGWAAMGLAVDLLLTIAAAHYQRWQPKQEQGNCGVERIIERIKERELRSVGNQRNIEQVQNRYRNKKRGWSEALNTSHIMPTAIRGERENMAHSTNVDSTDLRPDATPLAEHTKQHNGISRQTSYSSYSKA
jgi:hypothetical protein